MLRTISPGLKEYTSEDALAFCLESEQLMPSPPHQYTVTNRKVIGYTYLKRGQKEQVRHKLRMHLLAIRYYSRARLP